MKSSIILGLFLFEQLNLNENDIDGRFDVFLVINIINVTKHIPHSAYTTTTIKYYFTLYGNTDTSFTWTNLISSSELEVLKNNFANSMKRWNDVVIIDIINQREYYI